MAIINQETGNMLPALARESIESNLRGRKRRIDFRIMNKLSEKRPIFVMLYKNGKLRGSMGFIDNLYPLYESIPKAAINAALSDPRFPPLEEIELEEITINVCVLTTPSLIEIRNPEEYLHNIVLGRDGIIIRGTFHSALMLPQSAVENNWNVEEFLSHCCVKANLEPESWRDFNICRVYKFQTLVFTERVRIYPTT